MSYYDVIGIATVVCVILAWVMAIYYHARGDVYKIVSQLIATAEESGLPGPEKMSWVVDELYVYLPAPFRMILTREKLREIAQGVFDWMKTYALEYLEKKQKKKEAPTDDGGDDTFVEETEVIPEICEGCVEDCPGETND